MALIVHRHPEDLRSGPLRLAAALLAVMAILLAIVIVQQFGGDETASPTATAAVTDTAATDVIIPRSNFASDIEWLQANAQAAGRYGGIRGAQPGIPER